MIIFRSEINRTNIPAGLLVRREHQEERDQRIERLLSLGWSYREIAGEIGCIVCAGPQ